MLGTLVSIMGSSVSKVAAKSGQRCIFVTSRRYFTIQWNTTLDYEFFHRSIFLLISGLYGSFQVLVWIDILHDPTVLCEAAMVK